MRTVPDETVEECLAWIDSAHPWASDVVRRFFETEPERHSAVPARIAGERIHASYLGPGLVQPKTPSHLPPRGFNQDGQDDVEPVPRFRRGNFHQRGGDRKTAVMPPWRPLDELWDGLRGPAGWNAASGHWFDTAPEDAEPRALPPHHEVPGEWEDEVFLEVMFRASLEGQRSQVPSGESTRSQVPSSRAGASTGSSPGRACGSAPRTPYPKDAHDGHPIGPGVPAPLLVLDRCDDDAVSTPEDAASSSLSDCELKAEVARLRESDDEWDDLLRRLTKILVGTANALKGDPGPHHLHDWSDLPAVAARYRAALVEIANWNSAAAARHGQLGVREFAQQVLLGD